MNIRTFIPMQINQFEIGKRTLFAISFFCSTLLIICICLTITIRSCTLQPNMPMRTTATHTLIHNPEISTPSQSIENATSNFKTKIYNLSAILAPEALHKRGITQSIIDQKRKKCFVYIKRFRHVAKAEERKYGIPAPIKLAQALLESDAGDSRLAQANNNHFGIKCFSRKCKPGHCVNFTDDTHKDFFRKYDNAWENFRAHSLFLQKERYKHLQKLDPKDYKGWAQGLQKAGYATDPRYAEKLIGIVEGMGLD
jgi:flagellum-specific peptidoglycan hydrolase FlgJ